MQKKRLSISLMLIAGAIVSVIAYMKEFPLTKMLWCLVIALIVFYIIGTLFEKILNKFYDENYEQEQRRIMEEEMARRAEGSVIEKEVDNDGMNDTEFM